MKESLKIGLLVFAAAVVYLAWVIAFTAQPPLGYLAQQKYRHDHPVMMPLQVGGMMGSAFAQEPPETEQQTVVVPKAGTIFTDPNTGRQYRLGRPGDAIPVWFPPAGYRPCLPDGTLARPGNAADAKATLRCTNGGAVDQNCQDTIQYFCKDGMQIEATSPSLDAHGHIVPPHYSAPHAPEGER